MATSASRLPLNSRKPITTSTAAVETVERISTSGMMIACRRPTRTLLCRFSSLSMLNSRRLMSSRRRDCTTRMPETFWLMFEFTCAIAWRTLMKACRA